MNLDEVREMLREKVKRYPSQAVAARISHLSREHLNAVLNGHEPPGPRVLQWLGVRKVVTYVVVDE